MSTRYTSADAAHYVQHLCVEFDTAYPNNNFPYSELNILFAQLQRLLMLNPSQIGWVNIHSVFDVMTELTQAQISLNPNRKQASILLGAYYDSGWLGCNCAGHTVVTVTRRQRRGSSVLHDL